MGVRGNKRVVGHGNKRVVAHGTIRQVDWIKWVGGHGNMLGKKFMGMETCMETGEWAGTVTPGQAISADLMKN